MNIKGNGKIIYEANEELKSLSFNSNSVKTLVGSSNSTVQYIPVHLLPKNQPCKIMEGACTSWVTHGEDPRNKSYTTEELNGSRNLETTNQHLLPPIQKAIEPHNPINLSFSSGQPTNMTHLSRTDYSNSHPNPDISQPFPQMETTHLIPPITCQIIDEKFELPPKASVFKQIIAHFQSSPGPKAEQPI